MEINNNGLYILRDGIPGAFTPGCTKRHLPGFASNLDKLECKVVFVSVNDPSVMHEWNVLHGHKDIDAVADPLAVFSKSIGKDIDFGSTMGVRCKRFTILLQDGVFVKEYDDPFVEGALNDT